MKVLVFAEKETALKDLCAGARQLGDRVEAVVIGDFEVSAADKIWTIPAQDGVMLEDYTDTLASLVNQEKPELVLVAPTKRGKLIAGRLAAIIGASVLTDVMEFTPNCEIKRMVYGGAAIRCEKAATATAIAMIGSGVLTAPTDAEGQGESATFNFVEPKLKLKKIGTEEKPKVSVDLTSAKQVIAVGRGFAKAEDLSLAQKLAEAIGGEVGCSRPIAEGEKWMPKETYIGVSGLMLAPEVYFALGISGQVQHMVGCNRSKVVIAINKDKNAPIFKQADYGLVADLYKVLPAITEQLK